MFPAGGLCLVRSTSSELTELSDLSDLSDVDDLPSSPPATAQVAGLAATASGSPLANPLHRTNSTEASVDIAATGPELRSAGPSSPPADKPEMVPLAESPPKSPSRPVDKMESTPAHSSPARKYQSKARSHLAELSRVKALALVTAETELPDGTLVWCVFQPRYTHAKSY
jgi:hypothetical protein